MSKEKIEPENGFEAVAIRNNRIEDIIFLIAAILMTIVSVYFLIMVGVGYITTVMLVIWIVILLRSAVKGRKKHFTLMLFTGITVTIVLFFFLTSTKAFSSSAPWKYRSQKTYVELMHNGGSDCFPDKLPDGINDYHIDFFPSMLQGTGHFRVHFKTSAEQIAQYEKEYSGQAIYTIPLSDFNGHSSMQVKEISPKASVIYEGDSSLNVAYDWDFWKGHEKGSTVYVISAAHNWNHPHSVAVILNSSEGMAEFTHLG